MVAARKAAGAGRFGRNIMIFASEVPVISALNPYRKIEDVFFDVWKRTNPRQIARLQEELALTLATPEQKMEAVVRDLGATSAIEALVQQAAAAETTAAVAEATAKVAEALPASTPAAVKAEVVSFVTSTMHKGFGVKQEAAGVQQYQQQQKVVVTDRNLVFSKRKVASLGSYDVLVGGKIDGRADGKVIEVKNRVKRFLSPLPKYDVAQLQTYLFILGATDGELVEHLHAEESRTKLTKVPWDEKMWQTQIEPFVVRFGSALTYLMKDKQAQSDYLRAESDQQREIIKYLWGQELRETVRAAFACYDEDGSGWIDVRELRHVVADLGGVFTERDFRQALRLLDRDSNGVIDQNEFTEWWMGQTTSESAVGQVEKTLARLKDLGRQRFRVDIHSACWNGSEDVVARLVEGDTQLVNEKDAAEFGVRIDGLVT
ncbi:hypothetical protein BBJ28_00022845 [Nothophytophthora sp. Chile5]|nr:hypothetical protein BBJ28_00022845 [Nothophytophthora sp. Chile5]